jgi:hypothetical protein
MSFAKFRFLALAVLCFLIVGLFVLNVFSMICPPSLVAYGEGTPVVTVRENDFLCTGISQVLSDDENLYVLFGEYGVVQVYTLDGTYRYTISVYNHANGRTEIAVLKNRLYIEDKKSNLYVFENGSLVQYLDRTESYETRRSLPFGAWDPDYAVKAGSVWYAPEGVPTRCVVERPAWLGLYQNDGITLLSFLLVAMSGGLLLLPKRKVTV